MKTHTIKINDAVIKKALLDKGINQLKDPRYSLYFRINAKRTGGSWILRCKNQSKTVGRYPKVTTKAIMAALPDLQMRIFQRNVTALAQFDTAGELLAWHMERTAKNSALSQTRKTNIKYMTLRHLLPHLNAIRIDALDRGLLDNALIWPLQQQLNISTVRAVLAVLKNASKQAHRLGLIPSDPLSDIKFGDFITAKLPIKSGRLRAEKLPSLIAQLHGHDNKPAVMLAALMLAFGTRLGETRQAKWTHFDFTAKEWFIPAEHTKTKQAHRLPLTDAMIALLQQYRQQSHGAFVFGKGRPLSASDASRLIRVLSAANWTAHDLRKLARTLWADHGVDYMVGELLLNHALSRLDQTYIHTYAESQKRTAIERHHAALQSLGFFLCLDSVNGTDAPPTPTVNTASPLDTHCFTD